MTPYTEHSTGSCDRCHKPFTRTNRHKFVCPACFRTAHLARDREQEQKQARLNAEQANERTSASMSPEETMQNPEDLELSEDLSGVPLSTDLVPEGTYDFRVSHVELVEEEGRRDVQFRLIVQSEGPAFGRTINFRCDLGDPRGLSNLKTLYAACGYKPVGGHNPSRVLDGEFRAMVKHKAGTGKNAGQTFANISPWTIKPLF